MSGKVDLFVAKCAMEGYKEMKAFYESLAEASTMEVTKRESLSGAKAMQFAIDMLEALIPELKNVPSEASATSVAR